MRLFGLVIFLSFLFLIGCSEKKEAEQQSQSGQEMKMEMSDMNKSAVEQTIYYTCPMESHKHIHSAKGGKCSECSMDLVAAVTTSDDKKEFYGCPMETHSHVRKEEAGKCEECNMDLKPMRLKSNN